MVTDDPRIASVNLMALAIAWVRAAPAVAAHAAELTKLADRNPIGTDARSA